MNISISCRCGTHFVVPKNQLKSVSSFSCPICNRHLPTEHIEKIKSCLSLIDECHIVSLPKSSNSGIVDLGHDFTIDFVE